MAIIISCMKCGKDFSRATSNFKYECDECDGTNEERRKEEKRWRHLPLEDKIEELKERLDSLESYSRWDGRIG